MRTLLLAGAAVLAIAAIPAAVTAQQAEVSAGPTVTPPTLTVEQQSALDAWPADRQASYTAWPSTYQVYFWTLTPPQQTAYWLLSDEQRGQIDTMTPPQRTLAWQSIERQLAGTPNADEANAAVPPTTTTTVATRTAPDGQPQDVITTTTSNIAPPPAEALNKDYPLCSAKIQDSCQNRGEGGAPGRSRALGYWPGEPASETDATENGG